MEDIVGQITRLISEVVVPSLQAVQLTQKEQIAANNRLEDAIGGLRLNLEAQFAQITAQITACRAELAATQAVLHAAQMQKSLPFKDQTTLIH